MPTKKSNSSDVSKPAATEKIKFLRPDFSHDAKELARLNSKIDPSVHLGAKDLSKPHRMSWEDIKKNTLEIFNKKEGRADFVRWTDRFIEVGKKKIEQMPEIETLRLEKMQASQRQFVQARDKLAASRNVEDVKIFLEKANEFHTNIPDVGPGKNSNHLVGSRTHLHFEPAKDGLRSLSPQSRMLMTDMSPGRLRAPAVEEDSKLFIGTDGDRVHLRSLTPNSERLLRGRSVSPVVHSMPKGSVKER